MARRKTPPSDFCCLRIELEDITPAIWRRLWIDGGVTLIRLHHAIQAAMGWTDAHLHSFHIGETTYAVPDEMDDPGEAIVDERTVRLDKALNGRSTFEYTYDFGDGWRHRLTVEQVTKANESSHTYGHVEAGERACPPEDCGGPYSYQEMLDALKNDRNGKEAREFLEWAGEDFDPERFDRHAANAALLRMAWNRWGDK